MYGTDMGVAGVLDPFIGSDIGVGGVFTAANLFWHSPLSGLTLNGVLLPHEGVLDLWISVRGPNLKGCTPDELTL